MEGLKNKVAIVTGGSTGIGRATALLFAKEGAKVVVADINDDEAGETVNLIKQGGGDALYVYTDVSKSADVQTLVNKTIEAYGRLDFAVNNAGIGGVPATTAEYPENEWNKLIGINLTGVWLCMKYQIPEILKQGGGAIVNVASILGQVGFATAPAYVASKHGVIGLTKTAALEYSAQGLRVSAVCPGFIQTPMLENAGMTEGSEVHQMLVGLHPIGRLGKPEEVASLIVWLCSDGGTFMTGSPILVDGGFVAR